MKNIEIKQVSRHWMVGRKKGALKFWMLDNVVKAVRDDNLTFRLLFKTP